VAAFTPESVADFSGIRSQAADEFQRREREAGLPVGGRLRQLVEDVLVVDPLDAFQRERRAGAVAQQPFQTRAVVAFDAHRGVQGEAAVVLPGAHVLGIVRLEETASHEQTQDAAANGGLHSGDRRRVHRRGFEEGDGRIVLRPREDTVDDADVKMRVLIERGAEVMDEGDGADSGRWACPGASLLQGLFDDAENDAQCGTTDGRVALEEVA
jgi:hypothetical protein